MSQQIGRSCADRRGATKALISDTLLSLAFRLATALQVSQLGLGKIEGITVDLLHGRIGLGWPSLDATAFEVFKYQYRAGVWPAELAFVAAALVENLYPFFAISGLATRFVTLATLLTVLSIEIFVYPDAYQTLSVLLSALLYLAIRGPGLASVDHLLSSHLAARRHQSQR